MVHTIANILNKSITPICGILAIVSYSNPSYCGGVHLEMPLMWLIMALAHIQPWMKRN